MSEPDAFTDGTDGFTDGTDGFTEAMGEPDLDARESDEVIDQDVVFGPDQDREVSRSWVPPDRPLAVDRYGTTLREQRAGETLDQRLAQEEPDPWSRTPPSEPADPQAGFGDPGDADAESADRPVDERLGEVPDERSGRLVALDQGVTGDDEQDLVAEDVGIDGGAAGAEEAAMHRVPPGEVPGAVDDQV